jgi:PASTA domain
MRYVTALIGLAFALCLAGCGEEGKPARPASATAVPVIPDLQGANLDEAEERLDSLGIGYDVDSGDDVVVFEHLWTVCYQSPAAGEYARFVTLTVEHVCDD